MTSKDHVEDAVLAAYDRYAPSVSEVTADRCALAFREGFLAGHTEAEGELRAEVERLHVDLSKLLNHPLIAEQYEGMERERDELRAEVERLRAVVTALENYRQAAADAGNPMWPWPALEIALDALTRPKE